MKKILILFDGEHFSEGAFNFVRRLNEINPVLLTGVFLPSTDYTDVMIYYLGGMAGPLYVPSVDTDTDTIKANVDKFKALCVQHGIEHTVHDSIMGTIVDGVKKETRYADLLVLSSETFYSNLGRLTQQEYLKETMHHTECPVVIVPEQYDFPGKAIMAYDGSSSSVFAIKQFAYLFPEFSDMSSLVVFASEKEETMPDSSYIQELAGRHFSNLSFFKLDAEARKYFNTWLTDNKGAMLVAGSFGRTGVSEMFRNSFILEVVKDHKLPIFVAHK
jgi:nucleotide-binding universal stress UspA family protein